jgi:hemerythrin-like domain-containing protein
VKRAVALQPLSRDHLSALLCAKRMREAAEIDDAATAFRRSWDEEQHHFRLEEEVLLPYWAAYGALDDEAAARVLADHLAIRAAAVRLAEVGLSLAELRALGTRLHDHVRFEERELFPMIEQTVAPWRLDALVPILHNQTM